MANKLTIALIYAGIIAILHHAYHGFVQPWLNSTGRFADLPAIFLGSTSIVTLFIFIITGIGGFILLKKY